MVIVILVTRRITVTRQVAFAFILPFVVTVTLAAPIRFPFTLPPELTLTTRLFEERHLTEGAFVPFVVIVFFKRYDCPTPIRILVLFNLIFVFNLDTLTRQVALTPDCTKVQVIVQLPYFLPVTLPFALTVAIFEFELLQFEAVLAFDGATILRIVKLCPFAIFLLTGDSLNLTAGTTVTVQVRVIPLSTAVHTIAVTPVFTPVTLPLASTFATLLFPDSYFTDLSVAFSGVKTALIWNEPPTVTVLFVGLTAKSVAGTFFSTTVT